MSATARDLSDAALEETVAFEPNLQPGQVRPLGSPDMPKPNPQGQYRYTFSSGARPLEGYTIKRAVGRGGFGEVYYATSDSGKEVALKLILRNLEVERRGVSQCMNLKCPNLLTIFDLKTNDSGESFVIMEYVAGPSLASVLARHPEGLPPTEVRAWLKGLVEGVAYLHDHGIVHRDLKPANLFMEEGTVKIGDYGLAKLINASHGSEHSESIGTCHYMAPEIASGKYHKPIDVYAIGVILYEMLTGRVPFEGESVGEILMKHMTARPDVSKLPEPYQTIVARALAKNPAHRPSRLVDLLPPEDAPKTPTVRFIGEGKATAGPAPPRNKAETEDVFRIEAEEPIFYIGPETRPPRPPWTINQRLRAQWAARRQPPQRPPARAQAQAPRPLAPTAPPPLPSPRVRVAELSASMLWATPLAALASVLAGGLFAADLSKPPEQVAYLFGLTLLGTWCTLIAAKALEGRSLDTLSRRFVFLLIGLAVGLAGQALASWTRLELPSDWSIMPFDADLARWVGPPGHPSPLGFAAYFGLAYFANAWWQLTARDRKARFRVLPVIKTGMIALLVGALWPFPQPWGLGVVVMVSLVSQLVSPWSEDAARYARVNKQRQVA